MSAHGLNERQAQAVSHRDGALLVFAGAGSGKTRVITQRVCNLIQGGADPRRIIAVTFTNKAAGEMKERLGHMLGGATASKVTVSTFHAACLRILRTHFRLTGRRPNFTVYDEGHSEEILKAIIGDMKVRLEERQQDWPKCFSKPEDVSAFIERFKRKLYTPNTIPPPDRFDHDKDHEIFVELWTRYENALRSANAYDFADLIAYGTQIVERDDEVGQRLRTSFDYVMIDEFQDTDSTQFRFVKALASNGNLCVVGDDDQCIYAWRGAEPENIRNFKAVFPDATVVKLEQNYRSTGNVIASAVGVIEKANVREPKRMFTSGQPGEPVRILRCYDDREEASTIVTGIRCLLGQGVQPNHIAVLYRNHTTSRLIEQQLRYHDIRYVTHGGFRFFDRAEIRDVLSYFRLIMNQRSDVDCVRAVGAPARGVGAKTIGKLLERASGDNLSIFEVMQDDTLMSTMTPREREAVSGFVELVKSVAAAASTSAPATAVRHLLDQSGMIAALRAEEKKYADPVTKDEEKAKKASERRERLEELVLDAQGFADRAKKRGEDVSFADYIEAISLKADDREDDGRGVQLMTVHSSKGLEFDSVFLPACEQNVFSTGSMATVEAEDDERRLMYVAITRAQKRLYMLHAMRRMKNGKVVNNPPSHFLDDLPEDAVVEMVASDFVDRCEAEMGERVA